MSAEKENLPEVLPDIDMSKVTVNEFGVIRDKRTGRLLPGSKSLNPSGKPLQRGLKKELRKRFGDNGKGLVDKLVEILDYDFSLDVKQNPGKKKPDWEGYQKMKALEMAFHYLFGKPNESVHVDQEVDLTIETKMHKIAKLINDNKDKLRVIEGGGGIQQDVIYDDEK